MKKRCPSASLRNGSGSKRETKTKTYILSRNYRKAQVYERFLFIVSMFEIEDFNKRILFCGLLFVYIILMLVTVSRELRVRGKRVHLLNVEESGGRFPDVFPSFPSDAGM